MKARNKMIHLKETKNKNECIKIVSTIEKETDMILIDFGNEEMRPSITILDKDGDVSMFIIKNIEQIEKIIKSFNLLKKIYIKRNKK
jgi:hypothetical protein